MYSAGTKFIFMTGMIFPFERSLIPQILFIYFANGWQTTILPAISDSTSVFSYISFLQERAPSITYAKNVRRDSDVRYDSQNWKEIVNKISS